MGKLKTVNIKGKEYVSVNERLKYFRKTFAGYQMITEVINQTEASVISMDGKEFKKDANITLSAKIYNPAGVCVATGMAHETENKGNVNSGSHIENCETSAWGRALANFGIGIDDEVASADEMENATKK